MEEGLEHLRVSTGTPAGLLPKTTEKPEVNRTPALVSSTLTGCMGPAPSYLPSNGNEPSLEEGKII